MVNNLRIGLASLPTVYLVTGLCTIVVGPVIGKAADSFGKFRLFVLGSALSGIMVLIHTHLGPVPLPLPQAAVAPWLRGRCCCWRRCSVSAAVTLPGAVRAWLPTPRG